MSRRDYQQYCALARALDVVGERWTLLLIRELLITPRRFGELQEALPGMGTNLLASRLKDLTDAGLITGHPVKGGPGRGRRYELTDEGRRLEPAVVSLARWGQMFLGPHRGNEHWSPEWNVIALKYAFQPTLAWDVCETYEVVVDETVVQAKVERGEIQTTLGQSWEPDLVLMMKAEVFLEIGSGRLDVARAVERGVIEVEGSRRSLRRFAKVFSPISRDGSSSGSS